MQMHWLVSLTLQCQSSCNGQQLQPYKLFSPLLHDVEHVTDTVTLLQTLLVTLELIPEILDDEPF